MLYEAIYRIVQIFHVPIAWVFGSKQDLLDGLLDSGRVPPGRAIDLGCGAGVEAIYLLMTRNQPGENLSGSRLRHRWGGMHRRVAHGDRRRTIDERRKETLKW